MIDPEEQKVLDDIAEHGWSGTIIEEDNVGPGFEYSIGFMASLNHPEVIVFGLGKKTSHDLLWNVFRDVRGGRTFGDVGLYDGLIEGYACAFRRVHATQHRLYFGYAMWHRRHCGKAGTLEALQCFWPDKAGLFPWEEDCDPRIIELQPRLDLPWSDTEQIGG